MWRTLQKTVAAARHMKNHAILAVHKEALYPAGRKYCKRTQNRPQKKIVRHSPGNDHLRKQN
jgi:hypothetical protein